MRVYKVTVQRTCHASADFLVTAANDTEAGLRAEELAGDHEFGSGNAEYEVLACKDLGEALPEDAE